MQRGCRVRWRFLSFAKDVDGGSPRVKHVMAVHGHGPKTGTGLVWASARRSEERRRPWEECSSAPSHFGVAPVECEPRACIAGNALFNEGIPQDRRSKSQATLSVREKSPQAAERNAGHPPKRGVRLSLRRLPGLRQLLPGLARWDNVPAAVRRASVAATPEAGRGGICALHGAWTGCRRHGRITSAASRRRSARRPIHQRSAASMSSTAPVADQANVRRPRALALSRLRACVVGAGVEPATARVTVWCSFR